MIVLWALLILCVLLFGHVVLFGAPYVPTLRKQTHDALALLNLKEGDLLLELGSGDGRLLLLAAKQGIRGIGYELNPLLVWYAKLRLWRYRHLVSVKRANYWNCTLPEAQGIYVFLLQKYMQKLDKKIEQDISTSVKLVSFAFTVPGKKPVRRIGGMRLYLYK